MRTIELPQGTLEYRDEGQGPVLVFVHGLLVDEQLWSEVIARLSGRFRCIAPRLPLGAHRIPMKADAELSVRGQARLINDLLEALDLQEVTLVGNDTGGALCQLVVAEAPPRVCRLVLTNCDALEVFPPQGFKYLTWAPRIPGLLSLLFKSMKWLPLLRRLPMAYGALTLRRLDDALLRDWGDRGADEAGVRRDVSKALRDAGPAITLEVAERLHGFGGPTLLLWSRDDRFFPLSLAERLREKLRDATLQPLDGAGLFVPLDQPEQVAVGISRFCAGATCRDQRQPGLLARMALTGGAR